jgi:hypothetical protein
MTWDPEERVQLERVLEALDEAAGTFEQLVRTKSRPQLLQELGRLKQRSLRTILLASVLIEQQRRGVRSGIDEAPSRNDPNGQ